MRVILILIGIINLTYLTMHLLTDKVASNPKQIQSTSTRDNDLAPVEDSEQRLAGSFIASRSTLKIPQLSPETNAWNSYGTQEYQQGASEKISQAPQISLVTPIAVPSNLGMELPEFSLSYPVRDLRPMADLDRISDRTRPSAPLTITMAPTEKQGSLAVGPPVVQHKNPLSQGSAKDLLPLADGAELQALVPKEKQLEATVVGQGMGPDSSPVEYASTQEIRRLQQQLEGLEEIRGVNSNEGRSPGLTVAIPSGFGADNNTLYTAASFQDRVRGSDSNDGSLGLGVGLGDAIKSVGVELSYTLASFGSNTRDFGSGALNVKVHRRLSEDFAIAGGVNGLVNLGDENGFESTFYGVATKIFRTDEDIDKPFSRIGVTAGIGNGQFRTEEGLSDDENQINVFGNVAFRVAQPVSIITEWSGQDLGVGVSIAPFKNIPLVITPALRDIAGGGDKARFVLGGGFVYQF